VPVPGLFKTIKFLCLFAGQIDVFFGLVDVVCITNCMKTTLSQRSLRHKNSVRFVVTVLKRLNHETREINPKGHEKKKEPAKAGTPN
jgi:hypothetical protein